MEVDCSHALLLVPEYEPLRDVGPGAEYGIHAWLLMSYLVSLSLLFLSDRHYHTFSILAQLLS